MTPTVPRVLAGLAGTLAAQVLPEVRTPFAQQSTALAAQLCLMIGQEFDRAAARLVDENAAIVEIFERALLVLPEGEMAGRLRDAVTVIPGADLRVSALEAENDRLRALLVDLHAMVETLDSPEARVLEGRIWDELCESTRRRHLESGLG